MAAELIAFYGTLMDRAESFGLERVGPCGIPGELWDVGAFPALVPGDGVVRGELFRLPADGGDAVLRGMDSYEGYRENDEPGSLYLRRTVRLAEPDEDAMVYVWNRDMRGLSRIATGDWRDRDPYAGPGRLG